MFHLGIRIRDRIAIRCSELIHNITNINLQSYNRTEKDNNVSYRNHLHKEQILVPQTLIEESSCHLKKPLKHSINCKNLPPQVSRKSGQQSPSFKQAWSQ